MHLLAREEAGLRCLLQVALGEMAGEPIPIAQIAAAESISSVYAAKLLRQLRLASLVESRRGASGGYQLTRPAREITVWDAIQALDESFLPGNECACQPEDRVDCRRTTTCAVTSLWRRVGHEIRSSLEAVTLAELCAGALDRPERVDLQMAPDSSPHSQATFAETRTTDNHEETRKTKKRRTQHVHRSSRDAQPRTH